MDKKINDNASGEKLAILWLEKYILISEEGLLIAARRVDGDYEQHLGMNESMKEFKERRKKMSEEMC